jgi:hypothetical protein
MYDPAASSAASQARPDSSLGRVSIISASVSHCDFAYNTRNVISQSVVSEIDVYRCLCRQVD